ncbi:hypothetical protein HY993_04250 [Candidatus Micrarchaeota archaeon]|nr:hypothetical protein [Candidatus Micrarchaeota archaeon]
MNIITAFLEKSKRAQTATEFLSILALSVGLIIIILIPSINASNQTLAVTQVRLSCAQYATQNPPTHCNAINYTSSGLSFTIYPKVYDGATRVFSKPALESLMVEKLREAFSPNTPLASPNCVNSNAFTYCIDLTKA